jgi:hypothetical protein
MIDPNSPIQFADLSALAALANARLAPATPFAFAPFSAAIPLPADITVTPIYGAGGLFPDGSKVTLLLWAYQVIGGVKTYRYTPAVKAFTGAAGQGSFRLQWTWTGPAANRFVVAIPRPIGSSWEFVWQDIAANTTLAANGDFSNPVWKIDATLDPDNEGHPDQNFPCGRGTWLKTLGNIRSALCLGTDILCFNAGDVTGLFDAAGIEGNGVIPTLGMSALASGPWCVSDASKSLTAYIPRSRVFVPDRTGISGLSQCYTQCYDGVKFYFRGSAAPGGVSIGARNQLLNFNLGSDAIVTDGDPAHFHLRLVGCSTGHLKVSLAGGGTVFVDQDVTAGDVLDLSFDDGASYPVQPIVVRAFDIVFTTPDATASAPAFAIDLFNDARVCAVPDCYFEIEFNNPFTIGGSGLSILCTTCGQLTFTENNDTAGVWTAKTLPTPGVMSYLDVDIPIYNPQPSAPASSRRVAREDLLPYQAVVDNRAARWPVFHDTDFTPDDVAGLPLQGSPAWNATVGTKYAIPSNQINSLTPGRFLRFGIFVPAGTADVRFFADNPDAVIFVRANNFPTTTIFDAQVNGGHWLSLATAIPGFETDTTWFYGIFNPTTGTIDVTTTVTVIQSAVSPAGTFFPTIADDSGQAVPQKEGFSYHASDSTTELRPIPQSGYSVYAINIRRQAVNNASGVPAAPSTGTAALEVKLGLMVGFSFDFAGVFTELFTATIPAGQASTTINTFLPVTSGAPLAYQSADELMVRAAANFQPMMYSLFSPAKTKVSAQDWLVGYYNGAPWFNPIRASLFFQSGDLTDPIELPLVAAVYNDLQTLLNLI